MRIRQIISLIGIVVVVLHLTGCSSAQQIGGNKATNDDTNTFEQDIGEEKMEDDIANNSMLERSLVSTGNNYRMKKAMEQSRNGEETTIAYIGGSITEGFNGGAEHNYAKESYQYFVDTFGTGNNVKYINAGMAGTPSTLGLIRLERDVLQYDPDVVFVEFAVNDPNDGLSMTAFESLLRRLWDGTKEPAVVLIFTVTEQGYSAQSQMENIGLHYDLPMISVKDALLPEFEEGRMSWSDYSDDDVHPDMNGHMLVAEFIKHYYTVLDSEEKDSEPVKPATTFYGKAFENMKMLDAENTQVVSMGSFIEDLTIKQFPQGWTHRRDAGNDSFILDLTSSSLFIVTKESSEILTGTIEIIIDGELEHVIDGYKSTGWNNPVTKFMFMKENSERHRVEIRMAEGSEDKEFSILAFGVVE
ncbi:SGNH/GDSL hydrolase family protein [Paenibacillus endoradicis]|uniref:SGNH/GDSL hydrolase family protein n=1 Tax=Paenibacillus endoradicis TaxID=2972487 RepID=UPI002158FAE6|nr:SGNH/GDSL hydrolase family protein [Paenibacillus endoradicis]MCR8657500.1 SGNH/GDSL hydrolase family protein [Paenibacillus endoradicis]